jgi:hypothetical protein
VTPRALFLRLCFHVLGLAFCLLALVALIFRAIGVEIADEVRASRNETNNRGNALQPKNIKLTDIASRHRAINAQLAAVLGDTSRARAELAEAHYYADNAALPIRRSW